MGYSGESGQKDNSRVLLLKMAITEKDKRIIQDLAKRLFELAELPGEKKKAEMWYAHNSLKRVRPMILIFPEGAWRELITEKDLLTEDPFCREQEHLLRTRLYYAEFLKDDNVIDRIIPSPIVINNTGWGISEDSTSPSDPAGARHFNPVIKTEEDFFNKVHKPQVSIDWKATEEIYERTLELYNGILPVEKRGVTHFWFDNIDRLATWRGLDQIYLDMVDRPEWLQSVLNFMLEGMMEMLNALEKNGALSLNNANHYCGSGGTGFTHELPQKDFDGKNVRPIDMWGFATTQMFSLVSPAMHEEFALRYEEKWLSCFGLNAYGCCEPLHKKIDIIARHIPRLRRLSMSPWVDVAEAAEKIGDRFIFSYKPNPAVIAAEQWDPDFVRKNIRDTLEKTRGCVIELIMKDTHTCRNQPHRLSEWVRIAKEEAEKFT